MMKVLLKGARGDIAPSALETLLNAAERLLLEEGWAAVTERGIAESTGLPSHLVSYYFSSVDDVLLAVFRRRTERDLESYAKALQSPQPLWALWRLVNDPVFSVFTTELFALATHRVTLRSELVDHAERLRTALVEGLGTVLQNHAGDSTQPPPEAAAVLMTAVPGMLVMEQAVGISAGHVETRAAAERYLRELEGDPPAR